MSSGDHCVIVGASHAGTQAAQALRRLGYAGRVSLLGDELHLPYHRPPLSKDYLKGNKESDGILLAAAANYEKNSIELRLGEAVETIDREGHSLRMASGETLAYTQLVIATGSLPRRLDLPGADLDGIHYLRNLDDVDRIRAGVGAGRKAIVIGGGYIGLETAASLRMLGMDVTVLEAMDRVLQRVTCEEVSAFYSALHNENGVTVQTTAAVAGFIGDDTVSGVELANGETLAADLVIVGVGILPNCGLAEVAGLEVNNGIAVNEYAQTSDRNIYAIGDCASFVHPRYGRHMRLESVQNANDQALVAARAICDKPVAYGTVPWFWSDQFDVKLQIAGLAQGSDARIVRRDPENPHSMSVLHLKGSRLLAVDALNRPRDFVFGKKLIADGQPLDTTALARPGTTLNDAVA